MVVGGCFDSLAWMRLKDAKRGVHRRHDQTLAEKGFSCFISDGFGFGFAKWPLGTGAPAVGRLVRAGQMMSPHTRDLKARPRRRGPNRDCACFGP